MNYLYIIFTILVCWSCSVPQTSKDEDLKKIMVVLNDSAVNLMLKYDPQTGDTVLIEKALMLNDIMLKIDSDREYENQTLYLRGQLLTYLGRYKESFDIKGKLLNKHGSDIDKMIYKGVKSKMDGQNDSAIIYFGNALEQCNHILADSLDLFTVLKAAEIYVNMGMQDEVGQLIESLSDNYPEINEDIDFIVGFVDEAIEALSLLSNDYKKSLKESKESVQNGIYHNETLGVTAW